MIMTSTDPLLIKYLMELRRAWTQDDIEKAQAKIDRRKREIASIKIRQGGDHDLA
jgi:hypothetical protein